MNRSSRKRILGVGLILAGGVWLAQDVARPPAEQVTARAGVALIHVYQHHLHPYSSRYVRCRQYPTCSRFGVEALQNKGAAGVIDIGERLTMCARTPARSPQLASAALLQMSDDEAAGAACALGFLMMAFIGLVLFATWIALLVFVVRDAKNRGTENAVLWLIVIFFLHVIGLIIYFLARPSGTLVPCEHCKNKKLQYARLCPHCGNPDARAAAAPGPTAPPAAPTA